MRKQSAHFLMFSGSKLMLLITCIHVALCAYGAIEAIVC